MRETGLARAAKGRIASASALLLAAMASSATSAEQTNGLPRGFVYLSDVAPGIIEDMRYAGPRNFTGSAVPGYRAARCILARPVATALQRVQRSIAAKGYGLKVYDCYRPKRAVAAFVAWARGGGKSGDPYYYPRIQRHRIIPLGYVARRSSHSLGTAVDLTLVRRNGDRAGSKSEAAEGAIGQAKTSQGCTAPKSSRRPDNTIDMGTSWDCFDVLSHTNARDIPSAARVNRRLLLNAMQAQGFRNYAREWWHFSMPLRAYKKAREFPVE